MHRASRKKERPLCGGWSLDLTSTDSQGRPWDFDCPDTRRRAEDLLDKTKPQMLILSPMRTYFSSMMNLAKLGMDPAEFEKRYSRAVDHLKFTFRLIEKQVAAGRYFLFEHPAHATSWLLDFVIAMAARPGVQRVLAHQCRFGLKGTDQLGEALVKKPTRFLTNCDAIARKLDRGCCGGHRHANTVGNSAMLRQCAIYPPAFCQAIVQGLEQQLRSTPDGPRLPRRFPPSPWTTRRIRPMRTTPRSMTPRAVS